MSFLYQETKLDPSAWTLQAVICLMYHNNYYIMSVKETRFLQDQLTQYRLCVSETEIVTSGRKGIFMMYM